MALFPIITGLIVLIGSAMISKYQRIQESVLLRTLGACSSWALAYFAFETVFWPDLIPALVVFAIITGLTVAIGMLNSRDVVQKPPLEILRNER